MKICGATDTGRVRKDNQDTYKGGVTCGGVIWAVVCDGMGGVSGGREASTILLGELEEAIAENARPDMTEQEIRELLEKAIIDCNRRMFLIGTKNGKATMGTTVVCTVVQQNIAYIVHAGDSRAYYFGDEMKQVTKDHSMVQELVDSGEITESEARNHPRKNIITSAVGVDDGLELGYNRIALKKDDILLLCTDGLTNMLTDTEIEKIIRHAEDFFSVPADLIEHALDAGGADNVTVLLLKAE